MVAHLHGDPGWTRTRPPLMPLSAVELAELAPQLAALTAPTAGAL